MDFINKLTGNEYSLGGIASIILADESSFDDFQKGFRTESEIEEKTISSESDYWQPSWYVIGLIDTLRDPYFIDTRDNKIYFVGHDDNWTNPELIVESVDSFIDVLELIDNNLRDINEENTKREERSELLNITIEEITEIDHSLNVEHFAEKMSIFLHLD